MSAFTRVYRRRPLPEEHLEDIKEVIAADVVRPRGKCQENADATRFSR